MEAEWGTGSGRQRRKGRIFAVAVTEHHLDSLIINRFRGPRQRRRVLSSKEQQFSLIPFYHASSKTPLRRRIVCPPAGAPARLSVCRLAYLFSLLLSFFAVTALPPPRCISLHVPMTSLSCLRQFPVPIFSLLCLTSCTSIYPYSSKYIYYLHNV